jgi:hypothetical protein
MQKHPENRYKNLLVSGCSFTQDGIGGMPPDQQSIGSCSFIEDVSYTAAQPRSWVGFLARRLGIVSLINTASSSHGNILVANTLLECINQYRYNPNNTLIIFNISDPTRLDLMCSHDHHESDGENIPWNDSLIPYSFMKRKSQIIATLEKSIGFEQIERITSIQIEFLFNFLENKGFDFYFLTMSDYSGTCLESVLNKFNKHFINLTPGSSMIEYCKITNNHMAFDDYHPSVAGHEQIANQIYSAITQ